MLQIPKIEFRPYLELIKRRKWWIVIPLTVSLISGVLYVVTSPKQYRASTLILVEAQRVPNSYVQATVTEDLQSRLHTISQQVNSRTNLEDVIKEYGLYPADEKEQGELEKIMEKVQNKLLSLMGRDQVKEEEKEPSMFNMVQKVRDRIDISLKGGNRAFEISFVWRDPQVAAQVANALASQFIEENLMVREEMAMGTTSFLGSEADRIRRELEKKELALEQFKTKHMGMLPKQLESNLNIMNQLKEELNNLENRVDMEKQQAMLLKNQMNVDPRYLSLNQSSALPEQDVPSRIQVLEGRLEELKSKYTDRHPDVKSLKREISQVKKQGGGNQVAELKPGNPSQTITPQDIIRPQLEQIDQRISSYEERIREVRAQLELYKERVEKTSKVELQLKELQRGYEAVHGRYNDLLSKKLNAQMAEELEKRQKGEQFRVIDPAIAPKTPFSPDVKKIMLMALVLGIGLGGGLAYARESIDPAFYTHEEVEEYLGTKVLVSLPFVEKKAKGNGTFGKKDVSKKSIGHREECSESVSR